MIKWRRASSLVFIVFFSLLIGTAPVTLLAGDEAGASDTAGSETAIEEVTVTAHRRRESLQEFGGAITAITGDTFAANAIDNMQDLRNIVPNLYLDEDLGGQSTAKIFVRGIGIDNPDVSFDSPIGIYVDNVYRARAFGSLSDLYDVERVEFLRGPQGTLYGRNNSAGALRIITKQPRLDKVEAGASVGYGTENQFNVSGYWNMPLIQDELGLRVALNTKNSDGFMKEVNSGKKFKFDDMVSGRAALLWEPEGAWHFTLRGDFVADDGVGSVASSVVPAFNADNDIYTANLNLTPDNSLDIWGTSLDAVYNGNGFDFTSITAYRDIKMRNRGGDADGTPLSLLEGVKQFLDENQFTEEAFISSTSQPGGMGLDWTAGVFYLDETNDVDQSFNVFPFLFGPATNQVFSLKTESVAAYGEANLKLTDRLTLTGGLRYTDESKKLALSSFNNDGSFGFDYRDRLSFNRTTWKIGVDYAVSDNLFLYALAGTGFRSGGIGINPAARSPENIVSDKFEEETAQSYEGGFKSTFLNGAVRFNATYFYVEYNRLQLAVAGAGGITVNTPDATVQGLEAELAWAITDGLVMDATLGTQDDNIKQSDLELKNTPDWQGRIALTYTMDFANQSSMMVSGDVSYTDDYFVSTANSIPVDGYSTVNATARWTAASGHWALSVTGRNLTDEYYPIHGFKIIPGLLDNEFPNYPRRVMFEAHFFY